MRLLLCLPLFAVSLACSSPSRSTVEPVGFAKAEWGVAPTPAASAADDRYNGLANTLLGASLALIDDGVLASGDGPAPKIGYNELRMLVSRERSDEVREEAFGLGAELSCAITSRSYARLGFWILEEESLGLGDGAEVGRLNLGAGHIFPMTEATHLVGSIGFEWERDRKSSVNFFSLSHDGEDGLFGSTGSAFGVDVDFAVRHRLASWLEIDAGVRAETLREDSVGAFGNLRLFVGSRAALFVEYEDVNEPTIRVGFSLFGN
jgi:hypothetical protein